MENSLAFVGEALDATKAAILGTPRYIWAVPFVLMVLILLVYALPFGWITTKPIQEIIAPTVIALATAVATYFYRDNKSTLSLMLTCFAWALFLRELHLPLTNNGFYVAIVVLAGWAVKERDALTHWLTETSAGILLPAAFWTYFISKVMDRHYLGFLPNYYHWNDSVEETLETCGHLMVFALVIVAMKTLHTVRKNKIT